MTGAASAAPGRIRLKRAAGWRMPPGVVKVDRSTKWGNPFVIGKPHPRHGGPITREEAVALYRDALLGRDAALTAMLGEGCDSESARRELRGKTLACWCAADQPCHADVLLRIANG